MKSTSTSLRATALRLALCAGLATILISTSVRAAETAVPNAGWTQWGQTAKYKLQNWTTSPDNERFWDTGKGEYTCMYVNGDRTQDTKGRVELRWPDWPDQKAENMISADVMYEKGTLGTCIMQIKTNEGTGGGGHESIYLNIRDDHNLHHGVDRRVIIEGGFGEWHNIKAAYNPVTGIGRMWVDNKLKFEHTYPAGKGATWYFKTGAYHASGASKVHFKNITFWVNHAAAKKADDAKAKKK